MSNRLPGEKSSLFSRLSLSRLSRSLLPSHSNLGPDAADLKISSGNRPSGVLCSRCRAFISQYFSGNRPAPQWFDFQHGSTVERRSSAEAGCKSCGLSLHEADDDGQWIKGSCEQATVHWARAFEFYEPGRFACRGEVLQLGDAINDCYQPSSYRNAYDLQKDAPPRTDDPACFELAQIWLSNCCRLHPHCARPGDTKLPTRVLNVSIDDGRIDPFLFETNGKSGSYVTLSHRWEKGLLFKTTTANLEQYKQRIQMSALPATFRDAVIVCRKLGIGFLWIDALCIIQDSSADWDREAGRMASIYSHALFTISALHSPSSQGGLFCERTVRPSVTFDFPLKGNGTPQVIGMRVATPKFDKEMENSPLSSRGWVYQERVLSTATLHYGLNQMIWECRSTVLSECSSEIQIFTQALTYDFGRFLWRSKRVGFAQLMGEWEDVVEAFSRTRFTKATDRLPAIIGIASLFNDISKSTFIAGLWMAALNKQLLWCYDKRDHHRILGPPMKDQVWIEPGWKPQTPSWSWVSVDYPVRSMASVSSDDLDWDFRVSNLDKVNVTDPVAYRAGSAGVELQIAGYLLPFALPARQLGSQKPVATTLRIACGRSSVELRAEIDAGCSIPDGMFGLRIATFTGHSGPPVRPTSYFLLLELVDPGRARYKRIGIGHGEPDAVRLAFRAASHVELTLI